MTVKCIFYDCVGPLLIKNPKVKIDSLVEQIDQLCGSAVNDKEFWEGIKNKFNLTSVDVDEVVNKIVESYVKNQPMWDFHEKILAKYKTAVINNGTLVIFKRWIEKYDMSTKFDHTFNSAELGVRKPDKKIFEICIKEMKVNMAESVLIDDSKYNVDGAISAGMSGVFYQPNNHLDFEDKIHYLLNIG